MDTEDRSQRIAATLERQLTNCDAALATCLEGRSPGDLLSEWPLKRMLSLMKTSAQLASTIGRLEVRAAEKNRD